MPNWTYVFPYNQEVRDDLVKQGLPCPAINAGNRPPTAAEVTTASEQLRDLLEQHPIAVECFDSDFDWERPDSVATTLCVLGDWHGHWHLLLALAEICGQLMYWPGSGAPGLILEPGMDPQVIDDAYREAVERDNSWEYLFRSLYAQ
jgi:hypothetical protein